MTGGLSSKQVDSILKQIEELKAIFILGQRVIPLLEELFQFVREIGPMLNEINKSIAESSNKIPKASNQLNNVTKATEIATTEILDTLDGIAFKLGELKTLVSMSKSDYEKQRRLLSRINKKLINREYDKVMPLWTKFYNSFPGLNNYETILSKLDSVKEGTNNIMISLQVQDITAQQIAAVNHLMESVQEKMVSLLSKLGNVKGSDGGSTDADESQAYSAFNSEATYDRSGERQKVVDEMFKGGIKDGKDETKHEDSQVTSQDEIDKLFDAK
jgi:chemotaxis regulatin CheY-phosphate phosphatase CheZ